MRVLFFVALTIIQNCFGAAGWKLLKTSRCNAVKVSELRNRSFSKPASIVACWQQQKHFIHINLGTARRVAGAAVQDKVMSVACIMTLVGLAAARSL